MSDSIHDYWQSPEPEPDRFCAVCGDHVLRESWIAGWADVCSKECSHVWLQLHPTCTICRDFLDSMDHVNICAKCQGKIFVMMNLAQIHGLEITEGIFKIGFDKSYETALSMLTYVKETW